LERERKTPIVFRADVVVAGGGPAGLGAALAAARNGVKTVLVERYGCLGGLATAGLVITLPLPPGGCSGFLKEMVEGLIEQGAARQIVGDKESAGIVLFNPEALKLITIRMIEKAGIKLLLNSLVVGAVVDDAVITGIIVEGKSGRQALAGKIVVDATGDGDVATAAGAPCEIDEREALPVTLMYVVGGVNNERVREYQREDPGLRKAAKKANFTYYSLKMAREEHRGPSFVHMDPITKGQVVVWSRSMKADGTSTEDLTRAEVELRKRVFSEVEFLREYVPGFENACLINTAAYIGVRETRRIVGEYILKENDFCRTFPDVVCYQTFSAEPDRVYGIPYRCLLPKRIDNLLVAGRCFSATHEAQNKLREIPACMAMGQVAGVAAALSVKSGVKPKELDVKLLQKTLIEQGLLREA
jgi:hypothetical protein